MNERGGEAAATPEDQRERAAAEPEHVQHGARRTELWMARAAGAHSDRTGSGW
jgi:hypothetical protein